VRILLHSGPGWIGDLIRWQTRGDYSHASVLFDDGTVIESREFKGVRRLSIDDVGRDLATIAELRIDVYEFAQPVPAERAQAARTFAEEQLGKGYDYFDIFAFLTRRRRHEDDAWFCSELASAIARVAGRPLFEHTEDWEVSPGMIARSLALRLTGSLRV
jgi:uncharacterized protein YycO